ncbi:hypothetical protein ALC53_08757 [Atta colombica]|uniref:Uncharacterized protein n=1 Tax=Atta colombica TaxID=520822 RepID=A0A195B8C1_9HYME|nr:hypothetical protein ALC53_08757 [Atta colombica]
MAGHSSIIETETFLRITRERATLKIDFQSSAASEIRFAYFAPSTSVPGTEDSTRTEIRRRCSQIKRNAGSERDRESRMREKRRGWRRVNGEMIVQHRQHESRKSFENSSGRRVKCAEQEEVETKVIRFPFLHPRKRQRRRLVAFSLLNRVLPVIRRHKGSRDEVGKKSSQNKSSENLCRGSPCCHRMRKYLAQSGHSFLRRYLHFSVTLEYASYDFVVFTSQVNALSIHDSRKLHGYSMSEVFLTCTFKYAK